MSTNRHVRKCCWCCFLLNRKIWWRKQWRIKFIFSFTRSEHNCNGNPGFHNFRIKWSESFRAIYLSPPPQTVNQIQHTSDSKKNNSYYANASRPICKISVKNTFAAAVITWRISVSQSVCYVQCPLSSRQCNKFKCACPRQINVIMIVEVSPCQPSRQQLNFMKHEQIRMRLIYWFLWRRGLLSTVRTHDTHTHTWFKIKCTVYIQKK